MSSFQNSSELSKSTPVVTVSINVDKHENSTGCHQISWNPIKPILIDGRQRPEFIWNWGVGTANTKEKVPEFKYFSVPSFGS